MEGVRPFRRSKESRSSEGGPPRGTPEVRDAAIIAGERAGYGAVRACAEQLDYDYDEAATCWLGVRKRKGRPTKRLPVSRKAEFGCKRDRPVLANARMKARSLPLALPVAHENDITANGEQHKVHY